MKIYVLYGLSLAAIGFDQARSEIELLTSGQTTYNATLWTSDSQSQKVESVQPAQICLDLSRSSIPNDPALSDLLPAPNIAYDDKGTPKLPIHL
jgi:hypothetical protein